MFSVDADEKYFADFPCCCNRAALFIDMELMNRLVCHPSTEVVRKGGQRGLNLKKGFSRFTVKCLRIRIQILVLGRSLCFR